ncbi:type II toxin-antitoxin system HicB family antitoxin [Sporolactobacillus pectinivorans]|uniref:type II toxin-antitoxin system HicB family antitoxin n=1 Tax=Sporolactobacillus pectinivorans TaxID=1591408 RepID=UPI000C26675C|nr:type II toxin-antitoxin system HicB family antitoxin [Sporolactobacillus pectinivorans]
MSKDQYVYPAVFTRGNDEVAIEFPDLPGCESSAPSLEEGFANAREALAQHLYRMEENGDEIPEPSEVTALQTDETQFVTVIEAWMPPFRKKMESQAVKKTLTIPKWLDDAAKTAGLNYSRILQDALKEELNIDEKDNSFSMQERLNKQLNKVKKSLRDLSRIRVHVNMVDDEDLSNPIIEEINAAKEDIQGMAEKIKDVYSSEELSRLSKKLDHLADKISQKLR